MLGFISANPSQMFLFKSGGDYSIPDRRKGEELKYVDKKGNIMTVEMTGPSCCRPIKKTCKKGKYCVKKKGNSSLSL